MRYGAIEDFGRRNGLKVMFDAAHAFGCSHEGRMIGGFGGVRGAEFSCNEVH